MRRPLLILTALVMLLPLAPAFSPVPAAAQTGVSNGDRHPFYPAYTYRNGDWVRYETVQEEVPRSISASTDSSSPPDSRPWRPVWHYRYFSRPVEIPWFDPNAGTLVEVAQEPYWAPNPATWHRDGHSCTRWDTQELWTGSSRIHPSLVQTVCVARANEFHSHGYYQASRPVYAYTGEWKIAYSTEYRSDRCEGLSDCGGHVYPGWTYTGHSTSWVLEYTETVERTITYSCGSACTDVFVPVAPPVPSDLTPPEVAFDLSWRLDVSGPSPLLAQGAFADQQLRLSGAQLLCDGTPCDDPSLYSGDDFAVRPRPGGLDGTLSLRASAGMEVCTQAVQAGCDLFFVSPEVSGDLTSSGLLSVRLFSPPASGEQLSLLLSGVDAEAEVWVWEPQLTFVPDLSQPCTPTLSGCVQEGEWVASGPPLPRLDRVEQVDASLRLFSDSGALLGEVPAGQLLPLRVVGTVGS